MVSGNFPCRSEQYYVHVDPANDVLATINFIGEHLDYIEGVVMPVVWKHRCGAGRVFYNAPGHTADAFQVLHVRTIFERVGPWAARMPR